MSCESSILPDIVSQSSVCALAAPSFSEVTEEKKKEILQQTHALSNGFSGKPRKTVKERV